MIFTSQNYTFPIKSASKKYTFPIKLTPQKHTFPISWGNKVLFGDLTIELCKNFKAYLMTAHQLRLTHRKISRNSAAGYYSTFRGLLKIAYRDKLIKKNINDFLEKIEWEDVKKQYLTADELNLLAATSCDIDVLCPSVNKNWGTGS